MKKIVLFIIFALVLSPLNSCKKETEDEVVVNINYRLKEWIKNSDEADYKSTITYENERVVQIDLLIKEGNTSWVNFRKNIITYSTNSATQLIYIFSDASNNWEEFYKREYIFDDNDKMSKHTSYLYNEQWMPYSQTIFEYSGDNLSIKQQFTGSNSGFDLTSRVEYHYDGSALIDLISYEYEFGDWEENYKSILTYSDNKIDEKIDYIKRLSQGNWEEFYKWEYEYSGNILSNIMAYDFDENIWNFLSKYSFVINEKGLLGEVNITPIMANTINYYEEGKGNYNDFITPSNKILGLPFPFTASLLE